MYRVFILCFMCLNLFAIETIMPYHIFTTTGNVQDIKYKNNKIYAATSNGSIEIFDIKTKEKIKTIKIPKIKDFMQEEIPAKIYSLDLKDNKILIVSQGSKGYRDIFIYENNKLKKIIDIKDKFYVQKAYFISDDKIVFALLSNQIGLYNIKNKSLNYLIQVSASSFSDFVINENRTTLATTDESGIVRLIDINKGEITKVFKSINLDRVYQLDYKNNIILTAGQDRKSVLYKDFSSKQFNFDFLLYSCALSKDASFAAIAYNENSDVLILDTETSNYLYKLTSQVALVTKILFINKKQILISSDSSKINYYKIKE